MTKRTRWLGQKTEPPERLLPLRLLDGPLGEDPSQMLFVLRAGAQVAGGVEPVGRVLRCLFRLGGGT